VREIAFPPTITAIPAFAFYGCTELRRLVITAPNKIVIQPTAFERARTEVVLPINPGVSVLGLPPAQIGDPDPVIVDASRATDGIRVAPLVVESPTTATTLGGMAVAPEEFEADADGILWRRKSERVCAMRAVSRGARTPNDFWCAIQREVLLLRQVSGHPAIAGLVGFTPPFRDEDAYLYTQFAENGSLSNALYGGRHFTSTEKAKWAIGIALALQFCHTKGIVHCALNPENVMLDGNWEARLSNFSSAREVTDCCATANADQRYIAPEILRSGLARTEKLDIYSYGMILWELIMGVQPFAEYPFDDKDAFVKGVCDRHWRPRLQDVNEGTRSLLPQLWANDPKDRTTFQKVLEHFQRNDYRIFPDVDADVVGKYVKRIRTAEFSM
jgi:serine/threonine protein kinase